jgi:hypothetical protein
MATGEMTASVVAALLDLKPHPEGGYYAETFRDGSVSLTTSQLPPQCTWPSFLRSVCFSSSPFLVCFSGRRDRRLLLLRVEVRTWE